MATLISRYGYAWMYDKGYRKKMRAKLEKAGAEDKKIDHFFKELDKKTKHDGVSMPVVTAAVREELDKLLNKKKIVSIAEIKKASPKLIKKIKTSLHYKSNVIQAVVQKKQIVGVV